MGNSERARVVVPGLPKPVKVKKKCCRSRPRCKNCPLVVARLQRLPDGLSAKALKKAVRAARDH